MALAILSQPLWLGPLAGHLLSASSGRSVRIDSMFVGLSGNLAPVVQARGVHIENAPWAASGRPLAELQAGIAVLSWRSVAERRPVLALVVLRGGSVALELGADGRRNWRLRRPDDRTPGLYKIESLRPEQADVQFIHQRLALAFDATSRPNAQPTGDAALPVRLLFDGHWRGVAFSVDAASGPTLSFVDTGDAFPLRGTLLAGGARLDVDGRAADILGAPAFDARVTLTGDRLAPFAAFIGAREGEAKKAFRIAGRLVTAAHAVTLDSAEARIGATDLAGTASWRRQAGRNAWTARLRSASTDAADLEWLVGKAPGERSEATTASAQPPEARNVVRLQANDADIALDAERLHVDRLAWLRSASVRAVLADGKLAVSSYDFGVAGGHAVGSATLDAGASPPAAAADVTLRGLRVEALSPAPQAASKRITGTLQGHAALRASGATPTEWLASASGTVDASLGDGSIAGTLDAELGLEGGTVVKRMLLGSGAPLPIRCASIALDVRGGRGTIRSLVFDSARTFVTGTGSIDLPAETMDIVLTPDPKHESLFNLDRSIRLQGPLRHPARSLVARAAAAPASAACGR